MDPVYQYQGVGSMLLQWGCEEADRHGRDSFLIASPAGIHLYLKFGFKAVGEVQTMTGTFTSMFREAQGDIKFQSEQSVVATLGQQPAVVS